MDGDGDVRIVFHVRGNCISFETIGLHSYVKVLYEHFLIFAAFVAEHQHPHVVAFPQCVLIRRYTRIHLGATPRARCFQY